MITDEYYLCLHTKEQPDLNQEKPDVQAGFHKTIRFWSQKGVDGFRMDVVSLIKKVSVSWTPLTLNIRQDPMDEFTMIVGHDCTSF